MKTIFMLLIIAFAFTCDAQTDSKAPTDSTAALSFSGVGKVDSTNKNELYLRARKWFSSTYNDSKSVLTIDDKESGELSGNGIMEYVGGFAFKNVATGKIKYQVTIYVKDGRYKYEITTFIHSGSDFHPSSGPTQSAVDFGLITNRTIAPDISLPMFAGKKWEQKTWVEIKDKINSYQTSLIESLKQAMSKPSGSASKDW